MLRIASDTNREVTWIVSRNDFMSAILRKTFKEDVRIWRIKDLKIKVSKIGSKPAKFWVELSAGVCLLQINSQITILRSQDRCN